MKKFIVILFMVLVCTVVYAQRTGGSSSRGSASTSRSSVSSHSISRSVSRTTSSRSSVTTPSRTRSNSYSTPSTHSSSTSCSYTPSTRTNASTSHATRQSSQVSRTKSENVRSERQTTTANSYRPSASYSGPGSHVSGRPMTHHHVPNGMHPHPPMYHPIHHHHHIHMHHCIVHDWCCDYYWHSYWHYYHCHPHSDVIVYMNSSNYARIIALADDSYYIYSLIDEGGEVYFTMADESDHVLVKTKVHRKYNKLMVGDDGVWLFKNRDRGPMFIRYLDGQLYMYEKD